MGLTFCISVLFTFCCTAGPVHTVVVFNTHNTRILLLTEADLNSPMALPPSAIADGFFYVLVVVVGRWPQLEHSLVQDKTTTNFFMLFKHSNCKYAFLIIFPHHALCLLIYQICKLVVTCTQFIISLFFTDNYYLSVTFIYVFCC